MDLGSKPTETLTRVARYYIEEGYKPSVVRKKLDGFILQCDPCASLVRWSDRADNALRYATKRKSISIDYLVITKPELDKIDALHSKQLKRLAFTLLCLAKYSHAVNPENDFWVNNKDSEIMSMANISTSLKRQAALYSTLRDLGLIEFSRMVDNTSVRVCFVEDGEDVLHITDLRNLGHQYLMYCGEPYFVCQCCGITTKYSNLTNRRNQKYCKECAAKIHIQQTVDSVMRQRNFKNSKMFAN